MFIGFLVFLVGLVGGKIFVWLLVLYGYFIIGIKLGGVILCFLDGFGMVFFSCLK